MTVAIKFCGLTREVDAGVAAELGSTYAGVILAGGPRRLSVERAAAVLDAAGSAVKRVGVFGEQGDDEIVAAAHDARLDVVQLHADPTAEQVERVRAATGAEVWAAVRVEEGVVPGGLEALAHTSDALLLDSRVAGALGGTGHALDWMAIAPTLARLRGRVRLVLAGGLTPENVARAITLLAPDVVDVSSGVERSPGVKDPERMRAFAAAARGGAA